MKYSFALTIRIPRVFFGAAILGLISCMQADSPAHAEEEWVTSPEVASEIDKLKRVYPEQSPKIRYERTGHQYTTYIVARKAGHSRERSREFAFFSQYPDDEKQFSAVGVFFNIFDLNQRKRIMSTLHSLHDGKHSAVLKRRQDIQQLISDGVRSGNLTDPQIGLMIHALGDSYAHTTGNLDDGDLEAFGYVLGHLFHGTKPDIITYNPKKYRLYACALYDALNGKGDCAHQLEDLYALIDELKVSRNTALPEFETLANASKYDFDKDKYEKIWDRGDPPLEKLEVDSALTIMESTFSK
ncbi:MAG: hypothetical protein JAY90_21645 [Candidatus Thiodiazotropha lotti]|nr:hypothetical protein [Candidatus Thiodiazotropha lotti]